MANFKFRNAWSDAAAADPRYRDRLERVELPAAAPAVDQVVVEQLGPVDPPRPIDATWGTIHTGRRCKVTAAVLAEAIKLHADGESWPQIARRFNCSRMAFYHALRRPPT